MTILIASSTTDVAAKAIQSELRERGASCVWVDFASFPTRDKILFSLNASSPGLRSIYLGDHGELDLNGIHSIIWRRPGSAQASEAIAASEARAYVTSAANEVLMGLFACVDCFQFPARRDVLRAAHSKLLQLRIASELGFRLPETLITNSPEEFLDFVAQHEGRVITKPAAVFVPDILMNAVPGYTRLLRPRDLVHYRDIESCPVIIQSYVKKRFELRVTVVGNDVFAAEIHSQASLQAKVDWRRYDDANTPYYVHNLPADMQSKCVELTRALGLSYGAIDMILDQDNQYVFLEINPNGEYQWVEHMTGLPITERIARILIEHC